MMSYTMRDWDNTGNEVTKGDFVRIEQGIAANDTAITENTSQVSKLRGEFDDFQESFKDFKLYSEVSQIIATPTTTVELIKAMPDKSILVCYARKDTIVTDLPCYYGTLTVKKYNRDYNEATITRVAIGEVYTCTYREASGEFSGWLKTRQGDVIDKLFSGSTGTATKGISIPKDITQYNYLIVGSGNVGTDVSAGQFMQVAVYPFGFPNSKIALNQPLCVPTKDGSITIMFPTATTMDIGGAMSNNLRIVYGVISK